MSIGNKLAALLLLVPTLAFADGISGGNNDGISQLIKAGSVGVACTSGPAPTSLTHFDGTNGSTSFPDSSGNNHVWSVAVAPVVVDTSQSKFGGASAYFNAGTGGPHLVNTDIVAGTGDYTVDFWLRLQAQSGQDNLVAISGEAGRILFIASPGTPINFYAGAVAITGTTNIATGTWYHVALTRQASSVRLFVNGILQGSPYTDTATYASGIDIGSQQGGAPMQGWVDEFRLIVGTAAWTANFTPPTSAYCNPAVTPASSHPANSTIHTLSK